MLLMLILTMQKLLINILYCTLSNIKHYFSNHITSQENCRITTTDTQKQKNNYQKHDKKRSVFIKKHLIINKDSDNVTC